MANHTYCIGRLHRYQYSLFVRTGTIDFWPKRKNNESIRIHFLTTGGDKVKYLNYLTGIANRYQKEKRIRDMVDLAVKSKDRGQQIFTLAGILAFTDKVIDKKAANKIRRAIE